MSMVSTKKQQLLNSLFSRKCTLKYQSMERQLKKRKQNQMLYQQATSDSVIPCVFFCFIVAKHTLQMFTLTYLSVSVVRL